MILIDGKDKVMGRVLSYAAKKALEGEEVIIVNAEEMVITGDPKEVVDRYNRRLEQVDKATPEHAFYLSRRPDLFVKKSLRGMLPHKQKKGRDAYKRIKVYYGFPEELQHLPVDEHVEQYKKPVWKYIKVKDLCLKLGWKGML